MVDVFGSLGYASVLPTASVPNESLIFKNRNSFGAPFKLRKDKKKLYCLKHQICTTKKFSYTTVTNEIASLERHAKNLFQTIYLQNNYNILCCAKFLSIT